DKADKLFEHQELMKTPVVRSGRKAVTGFHPEIWKDWD
nr:ArsC family transcriptional regulator [Oscillospiraceae bacterium]